ncbi:MAG: transcriptional regulator, partial [Mesorhizobium sp.]
PRASDRMRRRYRFSSEGPGLPLIENGGQEEARSR